MVERFEAEPDTAVVYGRGRWVDAEGGILGSYPTRPFDPEFLRRECPICQPASWFRRSAFFDVDGLDRTLQCCFDYELWIRLARRYRFVLLEEYLATSRMHPSNKTLASRKVVFEESMEVLRRHYGYVPFQQIYAYCCYLRDGRDQFFQPLRHSVASYIAALRLGLRTNAPHRLRFAREWLSMLTARRCREFLNGGEAQQPWASTPG
jgi:hypothetical protein